MYDHSPNTTIHLTLNEIIVDHYVDNNIYWKDYTTPSLR